MASHHTSDEVAAQHVAAMGKRLGTIYNRLWNECAWLHWKWDEYVILFGTNPGRLDLLNEAAPSFFRIVQDSLWDDVLLHIARLTDPPKVGVRETLTIQALPSLVHSAIQGEVKCALAMALQRSAFARDWRNRHIAHRDLALAVQEGAKPLAVASRRGVKDALEAIAALLNLIEGNYLKSEVAYDVIAHHGNSEALLYLLREGLDSEADQRQRLQAGQISPEDFRQKPPL